MGVDQSRARSLPLDVDEHYEEYKKSWIDSSEEFSPPEGMSTLETSTLSRAAKFIREYFLGKSPLSVFEIMAGNGRATDVVSAELKDLKIEKWTATEIQKGTQTSKTPIIFECDSVDAVSRYGKNVSFYI